MKENQFSVKLKLIENYLFQIDFGEFGNLLTDEPAPMGGGEGPDPASLLAAAVVNCLSASLMFAFRKYKDDAGELTATVTGTVDRVGKFQRITQLNVQMQLGAASADLPNLDKVVSQFENFCTVTESVRSGVPVSIEILDSEGVKVHENDAAPE